MSLQNTPQSNRLTIGIFGKTNSGKSTLLNALTGQYYAVVSELEGTTTDPVYKAMEINEIGPVLFIDTAGFSDKTELGEKRLEKTIDALSKTDIALVLVKSKNEIALDEEYANFIRMLEDKNKPYIVIENDFENGKGFKTESVIEKIKEKIPQDFENHSLTANLCSEGDVVILVMPQDIQAPKGRLILPQVQILRELLDKKCIPLCCTTDKLHSAIATLKEKPALIITDSQAFSIVYEEKCENPLLIDVPLTSFSVLMAANKGDIAKFVSGSAKIDELNGDSKVLIAEACTHAPLEEDIGRVKIPRMLKNLVEKRNAGDGEKLKIDFVRGSDFPLDLSQYDLVIHCGSCMFNRSYVVSRQEKAASVNVAMTNYGIAIAKLTGILDKVAIPQN